VASLLRRGRSRGPSGCSRRFKQCAEVLVDHQSEIQHKVMAIDGAHVITGSFR
jgi:hypothetical protein